VAQALASAALELAGRIPASALHASDQAHALALALTRTAAGKAALVSGSLALAPGPLGLLTLLPDLLGVWRIQSQLVSDIAAVYGQSATLSREHMLYCLFKHSAAQAVRDLVVRSGERWLVREVSAPLLRQVAERIGLQLSRKVLGSGTLRLVPLIGAVGVGGYAWVDTRRVAASAIALCEAASQAAQITKM
jgi:hypothetical protein